MGCLFRLIATALSAFFFVLVASTALAAFLVFNGTPQPCVDRSLQPAPEASSELQANWLRVLDGISAGESVQLSVTEQQASALGQSYLDSRDVPVEDLRVYFCPDGKAQATGRIGALGLHSNVLIEGTLDVEGEQPRIDVDELRVGSIPGVLGRYVFELLVDEHDVRTLPLVQNLSAIEYQDGEAIVTVSPD